MQTETKVKQEPRRLTGLRADKSLMWPGQSVLTWIKPPGMPWLLAAIEPFEKSEAPAT